MAVVAGAYAPVIDKYLAALSKAPPEHLKSLQQRGTKICFGPRIIDGVRAAAHRRGRWVTSQDYWDVCRDYSMRTGTKGIYDCMFDAIVLPTSYRARDLEEVVRHELGHALTWSAHVRPALLRYLPKEIDLRLRAIRDDRANPEVELRRLGREALADAYAFFVLGREEELPGDLLSELLLTLANVTDSAHLRLDHEGNY